MAVAQPAGRAQFITPKESARATASALKHIYLTQGLQNEAVESGKSDRPL